MNNSKVITQVLLCAAACTLSVMLASCSWNEEPESNTAMRCIYHWKTTFSLTPWERQFLADHNVQKLYIRLFDVDVNPEHDTKYSSIPIATTCFRSAIPEGVVVVPCVYVANEVLRSTAEDIDLLAKRIGQRIADMAKCNGFANYTEVQLDCDWTTSTRDRYFHLCRMLREYLSDQGIALSSTMRLYQLGDTALYHLPVDRTALMCYNLGGLQNPRCRNSILDYSAALPFLNRITSLPDSMDIALPTFGWGVAFEQKTDGKRSFHGLLRSPDYSDTTLFEPWQDSRGRWHRVKRPAALSLNSPSTDAVTLLIREEHGETADIEAVQKHLAPMSHGPHAVILYHLDSANLSYYTYDEIEQIYSR